MTAHLVTDALVVAIGRRGKPEALLHHSDQGSQCTSEKFQRLMADSGVTYSMSPSGTVVFLETATRSPCHNPKCSSSA